MEDAEMEEGLDEATTSSETAVICRLCTNVSEKYMSIFSEEGQLNGMATKINEYLPINVTEEDNLPLNCCWDCTTTLIAWHQMVLSCVEADKRFRGDDEEDEDDSKEFGVADTKEFVEGDSKEYVGDDEKMFELTEQNDEDDESDEEEPKPMTSQDSKAMAELAAAGLNAFHQPLLVKSNTANAWLKSDSDDDDGDDPIDGEHNDEENLEAYLHPVDVPKRKRKRAKKTVDLQMSAWTTKTDEGSEDTQYVCQVCPSVCSSEQEILAHIKESHKDLAEVSLQEAKKRRRNTKLDQEAINSAKVVVDGKFYYNCKLCGKSLHSPYTYIWHMRIHTGERPFVCDLCGKQFRVSQGLVRHLRETHAGIKNFACDICGRMFATRRNVEEHRRIHTNERPYICDLCGKSFKQKASLFVHNRSHTNHFPFHCTYCKQGFRTRPPLLIHMTRHTGEKPFACETCGRCFRIKYELKRHMLIHSEEKPFTCSECGLSFRQKRYLRNHLKINHNQETS